MARLSKQGTEVLRVETPPVPSEVDGIEWRKTVYSYRSNGKVMRKRVVRYAPTSYSRARTRDLGWVITSTWDPRDADLYRAHAVELGFTVIHSS